MKAIGEIHSGHVRSSDSSYTSGVIRQAGFLEYTIPVLRVKNFFEAAFTEFKISSTLKIEVLGRVREFFRISFRFILRCG